MLYLSIDQGGSSTRAFIIDDKGDVVTKTQLAVSTSRQGNVVEQVPDEIIDSINLCIDKCLGQLSKEQLAQVESCSLVTQRSNFIAINTLTNKALTKVISWQDTRGQDILKKIDVDENVVRQLTGLRLSAHYGASKMAWCLSNIKEVKAAADSNNLMFVPLAAYLAKMITNADSYQVDAANASRTLLFNHKTMCWDEELLALFSLSKNYLPDIQSTLNVFGQLKWAKKSISLKYVNGDQSSALFAYGQPNRHQLLINIGTGAFVSQFIGSSINESFDNESAKHESSVYYCSEYESTQEENKRALALETLLLSIVHLDKQQQLFVAEGTVNGAGAAIEYIAKQLDQSTDFLKVARINPLDSIEPLIFINTIGGLAAPYWRTDIESRFVGAGNKKEKLTAVVESIVFLIHSIITKMTLLEPRLTTIQVSGGLSKNSFLCQLLADVSQLNIVRNEQVEASILGSVWWLAKQPEQWLIHLSNDVFKAKCNEKLEARYQLWKSEMAKSLGPR